MKKLSLLCFIISCFAQISLAAININTANYEQLQHIKGIGPQKAQAIIIYRNIHGKFHNISELSQVSGFGKKTVSNLANQIEAN